MYDGFVIKVVDPFGLVFPVKCRACGHLYDPSDVELLVEDLSDDGAGDEWACPSCGRHQCDASVRRLY